MCLTIRSPNSPPIYLQPKVRKQTPFLAGETKLITNASHILSLRAAHPLRLNVNKSINGLLAMRV